MGGKPFSDVDPKRRHLMAQIGRENTAPEIAIRRAMHRAGLRFRLHPHNLPGRPDIVLPGRRLAIFVHGCFWHGHDCKAGRVPKTRTEYWKRKFARNAERDADVNAALKEKGWTVVVIWECQVKQPDEVSRLVAEIAAHPIRRRKIRL